MIYTFRGGIALHPNKDSTDKKPVEVLPAPPVVVIPMHQHVGAPCEPTVKVGDYVCMGQRIGQSDRPLSAYVHASVSGTVKAVEPRPHPSGCDVMSVVIENDFEDKLDPSVGSRAVRIEDIDAAEIIQQIKEAGIVGLGGAGFPTHYKIESARQCRIKHLIINASECEPFVTANHRTLLEEPHTVTGGIHLLMRCFGLRSAMVAIEDTNREAFSVFSSFLREEHESRIRICDVHAKYPQGGEKQLIYALTRKKVPYDGLPSDIGCAVFNVDTAASIYRSVSFGMPLMMRQLTVSGPAVGIPKNLQVRIGTPFSYVLDKCGFAARPKRIIAGGPMMGVAQHTLDVPVIKTTTAILAFDDDVPRSEENPRCIRCGRCVSVCPMRLMPNLLALNAEYNNLDECRRRNISDCIECGCCAYVCPGKLHIVQQIRSAKAAIARQEKKKEVPHG